MSAGGDDTRACRPRRRRVKMRVNLTGGEGPVMGGRGLNRKAEAALVLVLGIVGAWLAARRVYQSLLGYVPEPVA